MRPPPVALPLSRTDAPPPPHSPPGHGKTSFLRALAGLLPGPAGGVLKGHVRYNGLDILDSKAVTASGVNIRLLANYTEQLDNHLPFLTVRETLTFAWSNSTVAPSADLLGSAMAAAAAESKVDEVIALLKLGGCQHTLIGNEFLRGVSGGEKKRVTIGETLVTDARLLCMDEISTGLDASVTYEICASLRQWAHAKKITVIISLLQPTPETVGTFDDIVLLREGSVVFHAPAATVSPYLRGLGFFPPDEAGSDLADWLNDLLDSPTKVMMRHQADSVSASMDKLDQLADLGSAPRTTEGLAAAWLGSEVCKKRLSDASASELVLKSEYAKAQYGVAFPRSQTHHLMSVFKRQNILTYRNPLLLYGRAVSAAVIGILIGLFWYKTAVGSYYQTYGLMLFAILQAGFTNMTELPFALFFKGVAVRQTRSGLYPTWTYPVSGFVSIMPITIIETLVLSLIIYYMAGLAKEGGRWAFWALTLWLVNVVMGASFRVVAYIMPDFETAMVASSPLFAVFVIFAGFLVLPSLMGTVVAGHPWMEFLYFFNPVAYGLRSLTLNEFVSSKYELYTAGNPAAASLLNLPSTSVLIPPSEMATPYFTSAVCGANPSLMCSTVNLGESILTYMSISSKMPWKWGGIGYLFFQLFNFLGSAAMALDLYGKFTVFNVGTSRTRGADDVDLHTSVAVDHPRSVLPFTPMSVAWRALKYTVKLADGTSKTLLNGISGVAQPGRFVALMGASGAGKTTLLDVLAGRKTAGVTEGEIFLAGRPRDGTSFSRMTAYCEQTDVHNSFATVREALHFSAYLRLAAEIDVGTREAFVEEVITLLELGEIANRMIGESGSADGLAPGQRKIVTIAVELCANTPILFLDEPTSGLDARAAALVIREVRKIADTGRSVITTIHQPNSDIFFTFDDVVVLQKGGWMSYVGPVGRRGRAMIDHVQTLPGAHPCPRHMNPASWILDVLSGSNSSGCGVVVSESNAAFLKDGPKLQQFLLDSPSWKQSSAALDEACVPAPGSVAFAFSSVYARTYIEQLVACTARASRSMWRNTSYVYFKMMMVLGLMICFGTTYYKVKPKLDCGGFGPADTKTCINTPAGVASLVAAIPFAALFSGYLNMVTVLPQMSRERASFYRERFSKMYSPEIHGLSYFFSEIPYVFFCTFFWYTPLYFMMGLPANAGKYFTFMLIMGQNLTVWIGIGQTASAYFPTADIAQLVLGVISPLFFMFCGVFLQKSLIPEGSSSNPLNNHPHIYFQWCYYIDFVSYVLEGLIPMQFVDNHSQSAVQHMVKIPGGGLVNSYDYVVAAYGMRYEQRWSDVGCLFAFMVGFQVFHALALRNKVFLNR